MDKKMWDELHGYLDSEHPCIVCNSKDLISWAKLNYLSAKKCVHCGMISVNPHFNDEGLRLLYSNYFQKREENELLKIQRDDVYEIDHNWVTKFIDVGTVLDIGCSGGFFLSKFSADKWEREGVEIAGDSADYARNNYGINIHEGLITEIEFDKKYDLVMMRGVIEHFRDPISVFEKCKDLINPGGYIFLTATPAGDSFAFDVYREKWVLFSPLDHIHFFTIDLLNEVLQRYGFIHVSHHYQYQETPYANPGRDFDKIQKDICLKAEGRFSEIDGSVPFPGSMLTGLWQKSCT